MWSANKTPGLLGAGPGVLAALISASPSPGIPRVSREQLDKLEACVWALV
jgi:hypothetical protein